MGCNVIDSMYYQIARASLYNYCDKVKNGACEYEIINSDDTEFSTNGFRGSAFLINDKLIFGFSGAIFDNLIDGTHDLINATMIMIGSTPYQLEQAEGFVSFAKEQLEGQYDKVFATGMSLGGSLVEIVHYNQPFDHVFSFDSIGTKPFNCGKIDSKVSLIYISNNPINSIRSHSAATIIKEKDASFAHIEQSIMNIPFLSSHDPWVLATGSISEEQIEIAGNYSEIDKSSIVEEFCFA